jgi:hypothetical protein
MSAIRIISKLHHSTLRSQTRTIQDALAAVIDSKEMTPTSNATLIVRQSSSPGVYFSALAFDSTKGDTVWFALPISRGCWATDTLDRTTHISLDRLDGAEVDSDGNLSLLDGTSLHAIVLDVIPLHVTLPELEEAIVYLTIRFLNAKECFLTYENIFFGIDYSALPNLSVASVEKLVSYMNEHINDVMKSDSQTTIKAATVRRTLQTVGIRVARGRPRSNARDTIK